MNCFHRYFVYICTIFSERNRVHLRKIIPYVNQIMLQEQKPRILSPPSVTTRSNSSPATSTDEPQPIVHVPDQPPSPSSSPPTPPTTTPSQTPRVTARSGSTSTRSPVKEKWILSKDHRKFSPKPITTTVPPPPGQYHDYHALAEKARALRDSIMSARRASQST